MLVLSRRKDESIIINENIEIKILEIDGDKVKIGINAPKEIEIYRKELYEEVKKENISAAKIDNNLLSELIQFINKEDERPKK